jgi:isocitrate lyase
MALEKGERREFNKTNMMDEENKAQTKKYNLELMIFSDTEQGFSSLKNETKQLTL